MDNRQRNIIIIIALILLYFYFNKKTKKTTKVSTPEFPPYAGTCPYMLDEDRQTPTPLVEGNNSDYMVGVDPELKGDFKIYYWCCPIGQGSKTTKLAILVWEAYNDPIAMDTLHGYTGSDPNVVQYLTDRYQQYARCYGKCPADTSLGDDNIAKAYNRYLQSEKFLKDKINNPNYDSAITRSQLTSMTWSLDKTTMMQRILDAKIKYCQDNPTAVVDGTGGGYSVPCGTCSAVLQRNKNQNNINKPEQWIDYECLKQKMIYIKETIEDTQTSTYGQYGSMPIVAETKSAVMGSPLLKKLEEISVNFDFMKDDGTIANYSKIFKIEWSSYSNGGLRAEPDAKIVACDI